MKTSTSKRLRVLALSVVAVLALVTLVVDLWPRNDPDYVRATKPVAANGEPAGTNAGDSPDSAGSADGAGSTDPTDPAGSATAPGSPAGATNGVTIPGGRRPGNAPTTGGSAGDPSSTDPASNGSSSNSAPSNGSGPTGGGPANPGTPQGVTPTTPTPTDPSEKDVDLVGGPGLESRYPGDLVRYYATVDGNGAPVSTDQKCTIFVNTASVPITITGLSTTLPGIEVWRVSPDEYPLCQVASDSGTPATPTSDVPVCRSGLRLEPSAGCVIGLRSTQQLPAPVENPLDNPYPGDFVIGYSTRCTNRDAAPCNDAGLGGVTLPATAHWEGRSPLELVVLRQDATVPADG